MTKKTNGTSSFSMRLTQGQFDTLRQNAGSMPLSTYAKSVLFAEDVQTVRQSPRVIDGDRMLLAKILAQLGQSEIASNLETMAREAEAGNLVVDQVERLCLLRAYAELKKIRELLLASLGKSFVAKAMKDTSAKAMED